MISPIVFVLPIVFIGFFIFLSFLWRYYQHRRYMEIVAANGGVPPPGLVYPGSRMPQGYAAHHYHHPPGTVPGQPYAPYGNGGYPPGTQVVVLSTPGAYPEGVPVGSVPPMYAPSAQAYATPVTMSQQGPPTTAAAYVR